MIAPPLDSDREHTTPCVRCRHAIGTVRDDPGPICASCAGDMIAMLRKHIAGKRASLPRSMTFDEFVEKHFHCKENFESEPASVMNAVRAAFDAGHVGAR